MAQDQLPIPDTAYNARSFRVDFQLLEMYGRMNFEEKTRVFLQLQEEVRRVAAVSPFLQKKEGIGMTEGMVGKALQLLSGLRQEYCLIGGWAVIYYGHIRATEDVDFLIMGKREDMKEIYESLIVQGYEGQFNPSELFDPVGDLIRIQGSGVRIDLLQAKKKYEENLIGRARNVELFGHAVKIVAPEDLILLKLEAGSYRDLDDAAHVYHAVLAKEALDLPYLMEMARELGKEQILQEIMMMRE